MFVITDEWFCSDTCHRKGRHDKSLDRVLEYSKALTWDGLNYLVRRDAVRNGDGKAMIDHWSFDLIQFSNKHHYKYFIIAHQLLFGVYWFSCIDKKFTA